MARPRITYHKDAEKALVESQEMRSHLDRLAFAIVGNAVPHVGVDTGALINSLGHRIEKSGDGSLVAILVSGAADGVQPIYYAAPHMAGVTDPTVKAPRNAPSRPKRDHPTTKAPTRPFKKALDQMGIKYRVRPGGFEA
jgi:hypothetical protein